MRLGQETSTSDSRARWDIFSAVVDNYGDIGVCWRLARQLAAEHGLNVRLWTDDLISFQKINPEIDPRLPIQFSRGVEIRQWAESNLAEPADVVVEAFACQLPATYETAMAESGRRHAWVNLEYLSAEEWVDGYHCLPSPHPRLPLTKFFFFPGFTPSTGGLLVEKGLADRRGRFQADARQLNDFWLGLALPAPEQEETRISLFCYDNNSASALFAAWAVATTSPITCLVPEGVATKQISAFFEAPYSGAGNLFKKGSLIVRVLPFLEQDSYDRLLWACDFNFVRGEDSFVRAQWAARPMAWQIYPQEGGAHWMKLKAFSDRYCADLPQAAATGMSAFLQAWNLAEGGGPDWDKLWKHRAMLGKHAQEWANRLIKKEDLATNLVKFCNNKLK